jgi:hypothetical protein
MSIKYYPIFLSTIPLLEAGQGDKDFDGKA